MDIFGLIVAVIALMLIGVGIALGLVACAAGGGLLATGVVSSSVIVGFWKRRTLAGVQMFFVQCGILAGAPVGAVLAWIAWHVWPMIDGEWHVLAAGAAGGAIAGLITAWMASVATNGIAKHAWPWLRQRVSVFQRSDA